MSRRLIERGDKTSHDGVVIPARPGRVSPMGWTSPSVLSFQGPDAFMLLLAEGPAQQG